MRDMTMPKRTRRGTTMKTELGRVVTRRREDLSMTQSELARRTGLEQAHVSKIERG